MTTYAAALVCRHTRLSLTTTQPTQFIDLTDEIGRLVAEHGIHSGLMNVQTLHTTAAIVLNEHEPLLHADFTALLERVAPRRDCYRHDDFAVRTVNLTVDERVNGHAHCQALLLTPSACLNIVDGRLQLGRWQRIFLAELDGPRVRALSIMLVGEAAR
jgi:secondary thiamine-phosphate synthase enzyme